MQGLSCGAGVVVSRADCARYVPPTQAQKRDEPNHHLLWPGPGHRPDHGRLAIRHLGWASISWLLHRALVVALWAGRIGAMLPESLHASQRQPFGIPHLMRGYWQLCTDPRFLLLALASGVPFNGLFLYVLSAPAFLGDVAAPAAHPVLLAVCAEHRRHHGRRLGQWPPGRRDGCPKSKCAMAC